MAKQVLTTFVDDLDDEVTEDVKTVEFGLYGKNYTVDLGKENREILEQNLADFIEVANPVKMSRGGGRPQVKQQERRPAADREQIRAIREWGQKRFPGRVKDRGRIPAEVVEAYEKEAGRS